MLHLAGKDIKGATIALSGFGNVAWGAAKKATELGAKVIAISGPDGVIYNPNGMTDEKIDYMLELRASNRNIVAPFAEKFKDATFHPRQESMEHQVRHRSSCAFQNELNGDDAAELLKNGTWCCAEVSNMGCTPEAIHAFQKAGILFAPGKAVNAGGVATSGLEMTQNCMHLSWSGKEVDERLHTIMASIHEACVTYGKQPDGYINYVKGANIAGFMKSLRQCSSRVSTNRYLPFRQRKGMLRHPFLFLYPSALLVRRHLPQDGKQFPPSFLLSTKPVPPPQRAQPSFRALSDAPAASYPSPHRPHERKRQKRRKKEKR